MQNISSASKLSTPALIMRRDRVVSTPKQQAVARSYCSSESSGSCNGPAVVVVCSKYFMQNISSAGKLSTPALIMRRDRVVSTPKQQPIKAAVEVSAVVANTYTISSLV